MIDAIVYLNLDSRADRRESVEKEIENLLHVCPSRPIVRRFPAPPELGIGCVRGHAMMAKEAHSKGWKTTLVLEDDFLWDTEPASAFERMSDFIERYRGAYATCHVGYVRDSIKRGQEQEKGLVRVHEARCTMGYLLDGTRADALSKAWEDAVEPFRSTQAHWLYCADVVWKSFQENDCCYAFAPRLGRSRVDYSDLAGRVMDYG